MASRHTLSLAKALVRSQTALGSRGYAASSAAPSSSAARTPVRTFRKTSAAAAAPIKPSVTKVEPSTPSAAAVDEFPMPVAEAIPDYDKISPPLTSYPSAESGYKSLPSASVSKGIEGEATVGEDGNDWSTSFKGLSERPFSREAAEHLLAPLKAEDIEIKPDGLLYLPEIKYRRVLNMAFGPGGWGMAPRGETSVGPRLVSREWGLVCLGRLVSIARGEQEYFDPSGVPTATEACKSNALMRCCKDLGIASELWDPSFIRTFKSKHCVEAFVEHQGTKKKRKLWRKKDAKFEYPYKEA